MGTHRLAVVTVEENPVNKTTIDLPFSPDEVCNGRAQSPVEKMTMDDIRSAFRRAAEFQRNHKAISWEHGTDLVNIIAYHGDGIADRLTS